MPPGSRSPASPARRARDRPCRTCGAGWPARRGSRSRWPPAPRCRCRRRTASRRRVAGPQRSRCFSPGRSRMRPSARRSRLRGGVPLVPGLLCGADGELLAVANERHAQDERLQAQFFEPVLVAEHRRPEAELAEATRVAVDQRGDAELLREAPQLADGSGPLVQVHEVHLDAALGEESQRRAGVGALADAEDLNLHGPNIFLAAMSPRAKIVAADRKSTRLNSSHVSEYRMP